LRRRLDPRAIEHAADGHGRAARDGRRHGQPSTTGEADKPAPELESDPRAATSRPELWRWQPRLTRFWIDCPRPPAALILHRRAAAMTVVRDHSPLTTHHSPLRHLLGLEGLDAAALGRILDLAETFVTPDDAPAPKRDDLKGAVVANLFFEPSTRTRT